MVNEKVNRDKTGEADGVNQEGDSNSKDEVIHIYEETVGGRERVTTGAGAGTARGLKRDQVVRELTWLSK